MDKSSSVKEEQKENIWFIISTFWVFKKDKLISAKEEHPENIQHIFLTFWVLK